MIASLLFDSKCLRDDQLGVVTMVLADILLQNQLKSEQENLNDFSQSKVPELFKIFIAWLKSEKIVSSLGAMGMSSKFLFVFKMHVPSWN